MKNVYKDLCDEFFGKYLEIAWREKINGETITNHRVCSNAADREMLEGSKPGRKGTSAGLGNYVPRSGKAQSRKSKSGKTLGRPRKKK